MSVKWRALQHRHKYTYNAVVFPKLYNDSLLLALENTTSSSSKFYEELKQLISLNSIYAQINHAKKVASSFSDFLSNTNTKHETSISDFAHFYLELLFLENPLPLHRTLVSALAKTRHHHSLISACFHSLFDEYARNDNAKKNRSFCALRMKLSVLGMPKLGYLVDVIEECALIIGRDVVSSLDGVVWETKEWARPSLS